MVGKTWYSFSCPITLSCPFRQKAQMVQQEVAERDAKRARRLEQLVESKSHFEHKLSEDSATQEFWQLVWSNVVENKEKPNGMSWSEFFCALADQKIDAIPMIFNCDEQQMGRSTMMIKLAVHLNDIQGKLSNTTKKVGLLAKREAACRKQEKNNKRKAEEKFELVSDPVKTEEKREATLNLGRKYCTGILIIST